jgi:hypothetical protein
MTEPYDSIEKYLTSLEEYVYDYCVQEGKHDEATIREAIEAYLSTTN